MKERILRESPDSFFEAITLPGNEKNIRWEGEGKEFSFNGLMYDVVKTRIVNGKTILLCINDKLEDELLDQINSITKSNQQQGSHRYTAPGFNLLYDIFFPQPVHHVSLIQSRVPVHIFYTDALSIQPGSILLPPPRALVSSFFLS